MILENLFRVNNEGLPEVNPHTLLIECVKKIYRRDEGKIIKQGDVNIRVKEKATKELAYVYYKLNKEFYSNYAERERDIYIIDKLGIDKTVVEDRLVQNCVAELKKDITLVEEKLINTIEENLHDQIELFQQIGKSNKDVLSFLLNTSTEDQATTELQQRMQLINQVKTDLNESLKCIKDLSAGITELKKLRIDLAQAQRKEGKEENRLEFDDSFYTKRNKYD